MPKNRSVALTPTRDDPEYWETNPRSDDHPQPADHNEAGFFIGGPEEREQPIVELIATPVCEWTPDTPLAALSRAEAERAWRLHILKRQQNFLAALRAA